MNGIRREHREEDASIHELSRRYGVHRRTVRETIASAIAPPRKAPVHTSFVVLARALRSR